VIAAKNGFPCKALLLAQSGAFRGPRCGGPSLGDRPPRSAYSRRAPEGRCGTWL